MAAPSKKNRAREYTRSTIRRLDTLSGNQCAAPDCIKILMARDNKTLISKICHIEAASENGPRYNPQMSDDDRRHFNNLILLCDECHEIIDNMDNEGLYPVPLLQEWKLSHEGKQQERLNSHPSLLKMAINAIADYDFDSGSFPENNAIKPFDIDKKLEYNLVIRNRPLIEEYKVYYTKISSLYQELEAQGSFKKEKLLRNVKGIYLKIKGNYVGSYPDQIAVIQYMSDDIIEAIEEVLLSSIEGNNGTLKEDISFGISIVLVDAFMRCKILEEPPLL